MSESTAAGAEAPGAADALRALAASAFSLPQLRNGQLAGMTALVSGRDVLAVMPTGYGKSAIYQVAATHLLRSGVPETGAVGSGTVGSGTVGSGTVGSGTVGSGTRRGPAVVVSPLIALQEDQLDGLTAALGPNAAVAINSAHSDGQV
jgi:ATP-dependent DNA helicase RecQ